MSNRELLEPLNISDRDADRLEAIRDVINGRDGVRVHRMDYGRAELSVKLQDVDDVTKESRRHEHYARTWDFPVYQPQSHDLYDRAIEEWGHDAQLNKSAEECSELAASLNRSLNGQGSFLDVHEKIVDVRIMLEQLVRQHCDPALADLAVKRLDRIEVMLDD